MDLFSQDAQETALPARSGLQIDVPLTKDQKAFNTLIKKIEAKRAKLAEWEAVIPVFHQKYISDLMPLQEKEGALQRQLAQALDTSFERKGMGLTKTERKKLSAMIVELTSLVLDEQDDEVMKALYNKHSQSDFDAEKEDQHALERAMFEDLFGLDLGDDVDMNSPEDILKRIEQAHGMWDDEEDSPKAPPRKKTAKQLAKEEKLAAEESQMSQSIRETYRKLASALHPDREPDPAEKLRKTALMQRANQAYKNGNLLQLLELQLELEHIDQAHLAGLSAERMRHYLKILKGQLAEIEQEIRHLEEKMSFEFDLPPYQRLQPGALIPMLNKDVSLFEFHVLRLQQDLDAVTDGLPQLKALLKAVKMKRRSTPDFDCPF